MIRCWVSYSLMTSYLCVSLQPFQTVVSNVTDVKDQVKSVPCYSSTFGYCDTEIT